MAPTQARLIAVAVFGVGMFVGLVVLSLIGNSINIGRPMSAPQWEFTLEVSALAAMATSVGFAASRCKSVLRALCAVPIAVLLMSLVPDRLGSWLSNSFQSLTVNIVVGGLLFAFGGAIAGWLASKLFDHNARHA